MKILPVVMVPWLVVCASRPDTTAKGASPSTVDLSELSIEQLLEIEIDSVYGASKYDQKVTQAPSSVTIVTREEIQRLGARTLADILRSVRGVYVTYERNYSSVGIRGFGRPGDFNTRILLLINGHRTNSNLYDNALVGTEALLDVDMIERVEIIRGPSSSIYGDNAFFAVVNIVTRSGAGLAGPEVSAQGGSQGTYGGRFSYGERLSEDLELVLSGSAFHTDGNHRLFFEEFDDPSTNHGVAEDVDAETWRSAFGRLSYRHLTLTVGWSRRDKHVPTASYGTIFNDGREKTTDRRIYGDLEYRRTVSESGEVRARAYYDRYTYEATYPYDYGPPGGPSFIVLNRDRNYGDGIGTEVQYTQRLRSEDTAVFGVEYRKDLNLYQSNYDEDPKVYGLLSRKDGHSLGLYGQWEVALGSALRLGAGVRYDNFSQFGGTTSPRMSVIYNAWEGGFLKAVYGQAYRAPNSYELYFEIPGFNRANPDLEPERIKTYEAVYEQYFRRNVRLTLSVYDYEISDLISQVPDPADGLLVYQNVDSVRGRGAELEIEGKYAHGLVLRGSYAFQKAEIVQTDEGLTNSPRHLAAINAMVPLHREDVYGGLQVQYTSGLKTLAGDETGGFAVVNLTLLAHPIGEKLELSATAYNLLDKNYAYLGTLGTRQDTIPQDGRTWRMKLTYRF